MELPIIGAMRRRHRKARINALLQKVELWEHEGRDLFAALAELTDPDDDLGVECRRLWALLES